MQYRSVKGFTGWGQLGILLVFLGLGFILAGFAQLVIGYKVVPDGVPMESLGEAMIEALLQPENVAYARLSQVLGTFFMMFIPSLLFSLTVHGRNKFWLGFNRHLNAKQVWVGFFIIIAANFFAVPFEELTRSIVSNFPSLAEIADKLELQYEQQMLALSNLGSWPEFLMALAIMAFFPALFEELFFRGAMQNLFARWWKRPYLAIIVTSLVFSFIHLSVYLFISRAILGFVLGLMYHKTRNIWVNIIAHFLNNAVALAQLFWLSTSGEDLTLENMEPEIPWWTSLIFFAILFGLFKLLNRFSAVSRYTVEAEEIALYSKEGSDPFKHQDGIKH